MNRNEYKNAIELAVNAKIGKKKKPFEYKKNDLEMYFLLKKIGSQDSAIKWAKELANGIAGEQFANYNPQTMVFKLVEELNGHSEELNAEIIEKYGERL
jgi:hypothetical protein